MIPRKFQKRRDGSNDASSREIFMDQRSGRRGKSRSPRRTFQERPNGGKLKHFDIDALDPGYEVHPPRKKKGGSDRFCWVRLNGWRNSGPGIRPEKMRDWRFLERRTHQLLAEWQDSVQLFWSIVKTLGPDGKLYVAIDDPSTGRDEILHISGDGYTSTWQDRMLQALKRDPDCYGDFTFVPYDNGGKDLGRAHHRMERLIKAYGLYRTAFHRAVEARLSKLEESRAAVGTRHRLLSPVTFVVCNDGRCHVVSSDTYGGFTWKDGDVMVAGELVA